MSQIAYDDMRALLGLPDVLPAEFPFPGRDRLYTGLHFGIAWCVYASPLTCSLNGYVLIPDGVEINVDDLDVHGGITYGCGICERGWIGFDTAHAGDWWDLNELHQRVGIHTTPGGVKYNQLEREMAEQFPSMARKWDVDQIIAECKSLARQLAERSVP